MAPVRIHPMFSSMRHNKVGVILITLQVSLTLAILCNALFIIHQRLHDSDRPSGIGNAQNVLIVRGDWVGQPTDLESLQQADLAALRALPGVVDAYATFSYPLGGHGWSDAVHLSLKSHSLRVPCAIYLVDEHTQKVLDVRLIAGRWFTSSEIVDRHENDATPPSSVIIVTRALAHQLFPGSNALGQTVFIERTAQTIVGIINRMQAPYAYSTPDIEYSVLQPNHYISDDFTYIIRARPGRIGSITAAAPEALHALNNARVIRYVRTFPQVRAKVYHSSRGLAAILATVCVILLAVTALGIVGLTTAWVNRRRREVGIRRALGAPRRGILHQFQIENLIITAAACVVGTGLAIGINLWMVSRFEMQRMPLLLVLAAAIAVVGLSQLAVLWPALRASSIPPALATKGF